MVTTIVAATARVVRESTELQLRVRLVLETTSLEGNEVREHFIEVEGLTLGRHGGDEGIILGRKTCKQISEHLVIAKWSAGGSELVGEPRDLAEEVGSRKIVLFGSREFDTDLHRARLRGRGEFRLEGVPDLLRRLGDDDVPKNVLGHGREEATEQLLVLIVPALVLRIGYCSCTDGRGRGDLFDRRMFSY